MSTEAYYAPGVKPAYYQRTYLVSSRPKRRATSYMATAPATEALSDSTPVRRGMAARRSQVRSTSERRPDSPPSTSAGRSRLQLSACSLAFLPR